MPELTPAHRLDRLRQKLTSDTEIVEDVPAHDVLSELEQAQKQFDNHKAP